MIKKDFLVNEYIVKEKSMKTIAKENNIAIGTVYNYIKKYQIPSRKHLTIKAKKLISNANKGRVSSQKGKKLSDETKEKMRKAKIGKYKIKSEFGGHKKRRKDGYIAIYNPTYPRASKDGYVMEHVFIMEKHIGRLLNNNEVVHHKNKIRNDNRIENLQLMTLSEHARLHMLERINKKRKGVMTY